jgi:hypothetical protein
MSRLPSWAVSDVFWQRLEPRLPQPIRAQTNLICLQVLLAAVFVGRN